MRKSSLASTVYSLVCPLCGRGELQLVSRGAARCDSCNRLVGRGAVEVLEEVAALPDALGNHACDCGHPEMRCLPDGVYRCPSCGAEITPHGEPGDRSGACG